MIVARVVLDHEPCGRLFLGGVLAKLGLEIVPGKGFVLGKLVADSMRVGLEMSTWLRSRPKKVASPTFVIAAGQDALFSTREQERLASALKAKYALLPGTAHDVMLEPRSRVAVDMINTWITKDLRLP
jgi:pimeloyl-ACP methyl ester carboxylesterase